MEFQSYLEPPPLISRLGIGSAQFGHDYGISESETQPDEATVTQILAKAKGAGITTLDTAVAYGNAQKMLGRILNRNDYFRIITKIPAFAKSSLQAEAGLKLEQEFTVSLRDLCVDKVYGLMIHHPDDLLVDGGEYLFDAMRKLRKAGKVEKIGVSVYTADQIEKLVARYPLQLIQVPLSILDQRLVKGGQLKILKQAGVEIHARSVFLKGLIFVEPKELPSHFETARRQLSSLHNETRRLGVSPQALALSYVLAQPEIDTIIFGVTHAQQLDEILTDLHATSKVQIRAPGRFALCDIMHLNPTNWPVFRI